MEGCLCRVNPLHLVGVDMPQLTEGKIMGKTVLQRELEYIRRMKKERGMVQVRVWVPRGHEQKVRDLGIELRNPSQDTTTQTPSQ